MTVQGLLTAPNPVCGAVDLVEQNTAGLMILRSTLQNQKD